MLTAVIKFARVRIIASCWALVFLGAAAAGGITWKTGLALVLVVGFIVHANSVNDYTDRDIDAINLKTAPDRPLVSGDITSGQFWIIHFGSAALILAISFLYGWAAVCLAVVILFIDYAYSLRPLRLTDRTFVAPLLLASAYTYYSFSMGFWSSGLESSYPWLLTGGLVMGFVARLLLKDFRDVKGDRQHGKMTFLLRFGPKITTGTSGLFWLVATTLVIWATPGAYGLWAVLTMGSIVVYALLERLSVAKKMAQQVALVAAVARAANSGLVSILTYLLCRHQASITATELQVIPLTVGAVLIVSQLLRGAYVQTD